MRKTAWEQKDRDSILRIADLEGLVTSTPSGEFSAQVDVVVDGYRYPYWTGKKSYRTMRSARIAVTSAITWDARKRRLGMPRPVGLLRGAR